MITRIGNAVWEGTLKDGKGTNPEELLGAAHAGCFSMALANGLTQAGHAPMRINTTAKVHLEKAGESFKITSIDLNTEAEVPGVDDQTFLRQAETAKKNRLISQVLGGTEIELQARLMKAAG